jgi:hypothetical protein
MIRDIDLDTETKYRVRNTFRGDADHLGDRSAWKYFKITG